jgi:hypothetical protein
MGWWQRLLSVETPGDAQLEGLDVSLRGVAPLVWAIGLTVLAALLAGLFYMLEPRRLGLLRRSLLIVTRTSVVGLLCFLVFRPVQCAAVFKGSRPRGVVVLLDNSQSMNQHDRRLSAADRARVAIARGQLPLRTDLNDPKLNTKVQESSDNPARIDLVRAVLASEDLKLLDRLKAHGPLKVYLFGSHVRRLEEEKGKIDAALVEQLKADEPETALSDAVAEVLLKGDGDLPAALVVVTDGNDNASKLALASAAKECARLGVPLHIYGVGSSEAGTLQWREVNAPDVLFAEDTASVPVRWRSLGIKQGTVEIVLTMNGKEVARKEVPAAEGDDLRETVTFIPDKKLFREERQELTATIRLKGSDVYNDEIKKQVRLIDRKVKVLVVENTPRWEFKYLQRALLRDRRVEPRFVVVQGDSQTLASGPPYLPAFPSTRKDLFGFDLLILGDVPLTALGGERIQWIRDFVAEGRGMVQLAGRMHAPANYPKELAEVLPVEFQPVRFTQKNDFRPQGFNPEMTRSGELQEFLQLADTREENRKIWHELPAMFWHYPVTKLRPGAIAFLTHPTQKVGDDPMPLLALHYFGKGQVLFVGFEETWRWRYNTQDQYFSRFWGQIIYRLGLPHTIGTRTTQLALDRPEVLLGRPGMVYARLYDENFKPLVRKSVSARLEQVDGPAGPHPAQMIELQPIAGQEGEYRALLAHDRVGRFALKMTTGEVVSLDYRVALPPQHELAVRGLAEEPLREAASISEGGFYREEKLYELPDKVRPRTTTFLQRQQVLPWNMLALLLFISLITVEWVIRKFSNLS